VPFKRCDLVTVAGQFPVKLCAEAAVVVRAKAAIANVDAMKLRMWLVIFLAPNEIVLRSCMKLSKEDEAVVMRM
jgi:hypothetical protein